MAGSPRVTTAARAARDRTGPARTVPAAGCPAGVRETAQQPRMTRAEMRKAAQRGGKRGGGAAATGADDRGGKPGKPGKPGKKRFIDYPRFGKQGVRRWLPSWKQWLTGFLVFFATCVGGVWYAYASTTVPQIHDLVNDQNNIYYWADGSEMARKGETNRQIVELADISPNVQNAVIAAENATFRTDSGIDPVGMMRAVYNMATGGETQGASTITQQYVKNAYLSQDQTLSRKVREFFITLKVNQETEKNDILRDYLNVSWFGRGATGIQAASQAYYGIDAKDLDICQSAMLAGLLKGAALYDPTIPANKDRAVERWTWILNRMVTTKNATAEERAKCTAFPEPIPRKPPTNMNGEISYLVDTANKFMMSKDPTITQQSIDKGGYKIYTTFEKDKVDALKKAVDDVKGETLNVQKRPEKDNFVQFGAASVRPGDGAIVAIYGGDGVENQHFDNNADAKGVQVGSTFKPFVLAAAMQVGVQTAKDDKGQPKRINADSRYLSDDLSEIRKPDGSLVIGDDGKPYRQKNEDSRQARLRLAAGGHAELLQRPVRPAQPGRRRPERGQHRRGDGRAQGELRRPQDPDLRARHLHREPDPDGRRVRDPGGQRQAGRPVLGDQGRGEGHGAAGLQQARAQAGAGAGRRGQRHRRAGERGEERYRLQEQRAGPPGGRQDRYHRREQVGLVGRLHPAAGHQRRDVARGPDQARAPVAQRHRRQGLGARW